MQRWDLLQLELFIDWLEVIKNLFKNFSVEQSEGGVDGEDTKKIQFLGIQVGSVIKSQENEAVKFFTPH